MTPDASPPPPRQASPPPPEGEAAAAWRDDDLRADPHAAADKASRVRRMFAAIAPSYDLNNRLHSFGRDQAWRRAAVRMAGLKATDRVVDVACGTGDLTVAFAEALYPEGDWEQGGQVKGIDFTLPMLFLGRDKWSAHGIVQHHLEDSETNPGSIGFVQWINADAMQLPLPDACCDVVSIAFGLRNVAVPARAIAEFFRVLRPGGRVIVLEFSTPTNPILRALNVFYCGKVMPITATWIAGDKSGAYKYLPRSVDTFLSRDAMLDLLRGAGFTDCVAKPLTFGVAVVYRGRKRA